MTYVASQIMIWIVIATLFGFSLGWLVRSRRGGPVKKRRRF